MRLLHFSPYKQPRQCLLIFPPVVLLAIIYYYSYLTPTSPKLPSFNTPPIFSWFYPSSKFWHSFAPILAATAPQCPPPTLTGKAIAGNGFSLDALKAVEHPNYINMTTSCIKSMRRSHELFIDLINFGTPSLQYQKGSKGIVTSAGGAYFPVLLVSLLMLRRTGSALPVEVFLATPDEYESQVCNVIFPLLNAKCIILSSLFRNSKHRIPLQHYQLKIFAILFSSFESVLFLDADNFPVHPPEELFITEPFNSKHLILWSDFWTPTISPYFGNITGLDNDVLFQRPTVESGQILVSKPHHAKTLMLAAYYNAYGSHYYHLLTQDGPGEGDKETFAVSALRLNSTFHTVTHPPHPLGQSGNGLAILQFDPISDYLCNSTCTPQPLFIHASWPPKLNAATNQRAERQWGSKEDVRRLVGSDVERIAWGYMVEMACDKKMVFRDWEGDEEVCERTRNSFRRMFGEEYERVET